MRGGPWQDRSSKPPPRSKQPRMVHHPRSEQPRRGQRGAADTAQAPQLQNITITTTDVTLTPDETMAEQLPCLVELQPAEGAKVQATPTRLKSLKAHWKEDGTRAFAADAREALQHIAPQDEPQAHTPALKATARLHPALHMWFSRCLGIRRQL